MFEKGDLVDNLSCDLARARNKRDVLASDIITLAAEIAVLEARLSTENDRRELERAASEIERIKKQVNDQYLAFVPTIAGIRGATEMAAAIVPKARELDELLIAIATEVGNAIGDLLSDLDRRIEALSVGQVAPELPQSFKESEARRKANDEECIRVFKAAGYKVAEPRFNVLTYKKWLEKGRRVKKGEKGFSVGPFKLFHEDQTEVNGSSGLPLPIERAIPQQRKDSDPVLQPPEWLRRGGPRMRVLQFADIAVALTAFVAMYLLFNGEEQLPNPRANQLESIQGSILAKKSNRPARDNAVAAAYKFATAAMLFELNTHKKATISDLYLIHQQGTQGAEGHVNHPDSIAWKSMCATDEGKQKGEKWCKRAIWENTLPELKHVWKSVENLTSGAFVKMWQERVDRFYTRYSEATTH